MNSQPNLTKIGCKMSAHRRGGSHVNVHPDSSPIKAKVCVDEQAGTAGKGRCYFVVFTFLL